MKGLLVMTLEQLFVSFRLAAWTAPDDDTVEATSLNSFPNTFAANNWIRDTSEDFAAMLFQTPHEVGFDVELLEVEGVLTHGATPCTNLIAQT